MQRFLLIGAFGLVVILLIFPGSGLVSRVLAQRLIIDEYGQIQEADQGQVLGKDSQSDSGKTDEDHRGKSGSSGSAPAGSTAVTATSEIRATGGIKKFEAKEGKIEMRVKEPESEFPEEQTIEDHEEEASEPAELVEEVEVHEGINKNTVKIKAQGNELEIEQHRVRAKTSFPLTVGQNNELIVTTPAGTKEVTILPAEAVNRLLQAGVFTQVENIASAGSTATAASQIELKSERGALVYEVDGVKQANLLGLIPVSTSVQAHISAETGVVTGVSQPWFLNFFGFLFTK